jgi:predicted XRE-type DNA-binding protein
MPGRTTRRAEIERGSGNVFADIGHPAPDVALARAELARRITAVIQRRRLTQTEAADLIGTDQPKVSALMRGHLNGFSVERLLGYLTALGCDVDIVVKSGGSGGQLRVRP